MYKASACIKVDRNRYQIYENGARGLRPPFLASSAQQREILDSLPRAESWSRCGRALRPAISVPPAPWGAPRGAEMIGLDSAE